MNFIVPIDNSVTCDVSVYNKQGGEYRLMPFKINKPICDFAKSDVYFYDDFCANSTMIKPFPCPYPAGEVQVNGYTPKLENVPSALLKSGDYRLNLELTKGLKRVALTKVWGSVIQL
jgi:Protein of unknown function (DUF1091)